MRFKVPKAAAAAVLLCAAAGWGREVTLTVLHTTDLHGAFVRGQGGREGADGGIAQCASIIRAARAENPCHVTLDGGDFAQGTLASTLSHGMRMAQALSLVGCDAVALGNHEFDWGVDAAGGLAGELARLGVPLLAANLEIDPNGRAPEAFRTVKPYVVKEVEGLRVAVVGLTTPNLPNWFRDFGESGLFTTRSREALERWLPEVKAQDPDVLIVLAHQGLLVQDDESNEINEIGREFPEIDLLLGGHLHWVQPGARVGEVDYAQSGSGGRGVMRVDLAVDTAAKEVTGARFRWLPVGADTPADGPVLALVRDDFEAAERQLGRVLSRAPRAIPSSQAGAGLSPLRQLLAAAIREDTGAEVVLQGVPPGARLAAGDVTLGDVWRVVPYENRVGTLLLTPDELRGVLEENMVFWGTPRYVPADGILYDLYPDAAPGNRVRNLRGEDGKPFHARRRLTIAANSYMLAGGGGRFPLLARLAARPLNRLAWSAKDMRTMFADYLARRDSVEASSGTGARVFFRERRPWERVGAFENSLE